MYQNVGTLLRMGGLAILAAFCFTCSMRAFQKVCFKWNSAFLSILALFSNKYQFTSISIYYHKIVTITLRTTLLKLSSHFCKWFFNHMFRYWLLTYFDTKHIEYHISTNQSCVLLLMLLLIQHIIQLLVPNIGPNLCPRPEQTSLSVGKRAVFMAWPYQRSHMSASRGG